MITLVTTCDMRNGIDAPLGVPWDLPESQTHLDVLTKGAICIVDADLWITLSEDFKRTREIFVLSKQGKPLDDGTPTHTLTQIRARIRFSKPNNNHRVNDIYVLGGEHVFAELLPYATFIRMIRIMDRYDECTKVFPKIEDIQWKLARRSMERFSKDGTPYRSLTFFRIKDALVF